LIFQNGLVKDCEFSREPKQILDFVEKFSMADDIFKDTYQGNVFYLYRTGDISNGSTAINHFHHRKDLKEFSLLKILPFVENNRRKRNANFFRRLQIILLHFTITVHTIRLYRLPCYI
jgi:hypothetical protein